MFNLKEEYEKAKERAIDKYWNVRPSEMRRNELENLVDDIDIDFSAADHGITMEDDGGITK